MSARPDGGRSSAASMQRTVFLSGHADVVRPGNAVDEDWSACGAQQGRGQWEGGLGGGGGGGGRRRRKAAAAAAPAAPAAEAAAEFMLGTLQCCPQKQEALRTLKVCLRVSDQGGVEQRDVDQGRDQRFTKRLQQRAAAAAAAE